MKKQVSKEAYDFERYSYPDRWGSYFYQLKEVLRLSPKEVLEVGVGDAVFSSYIKSNTSISYKSMDVASDLHPDVVADITKMPFRDNSFDCVVAFEVLEHMPYLKFEEALREMKRVSRKNVVISIPHFGPPIKFYLKIPFLPELKFAIKLPFPKKHFFNGQHYWEIGKRGYSSGKIRKDIGNHFKILKEFVPWENQYHHFFILKKKP